MYGLLAFGVFVIALGFTVLIWTINLHLKRLRRDFSDLRAYLAALLGER